MRDPPGTYTRPKLSYCNPITINPIIASSSHVAVSKKMMKGITKRRNFYNGSDDDKEVDWVPGQQLQVFALIQ